MTTGEPRAAVGAASPFFIVEDIDKSLAFYREGLGFDVTFRAPDPAPFFAVVRRGQAQFMLKAVGDGVRALPNRARHEWARWDCYVDAPDPDGLAAELGGRGIAFSSPLADTDDGLRGFEVTDPDGYQIFFGHPR